MSTYILSTAHMPRRAYDISHLNVLRPLRWLRQGFVDLVAMPGVSLIYGAAVAALAFVFVVLTAGGQQFFLVPFLFGGFLLIAPILSMGLLAMAKRREEERHDDGLMKILVAVNGPSLSMLGLALLFLFVNWIMLSNLVFGGFFHEVVPTYGQVRPLPVMFNESWPFALVYGGIAVALALLFFRMIAFSLPMLVDQRVDMFNAIFASWRAVGENWPSMIVWGVLIFALTTVGIALWYLGLIIVVPWLGYATWHAYRDTLVPQPAQSSAEDNTI